MADNITGIMTSKAVFYAMEPAAMERYASFKDYVSEMSIGLSTEEIKRIKMEIQQAREEVRKCFFVDEDGAAHIFVTGPLENAPDPCAVMFNIEMTTYSDIISETRAAEADNNIKEIIYHFDTPGGNVVGLFKAADEIRKVSKPTTAINEGLCASAGYALASQCDKVNGINISVETGSIGVVTEIIDRSGQEEGRGIQRFILTSRNAENKAPDVTTEAGRDKIVNRLTDLESVFVEYVALGRNTTTDNILNNFGRGAALIARDARKVGMIDLIESELNPDEPGNTTAQIAENTRTRNATAAGENLEGETSMEMTAEQLKEFGDNIAKETASTVRTEMNADIEKRDQARTAEVERVAGFTKLENKYPEMSAMIADEMGTPEAKADLDFAMKVADADNARIAAAKDQKKDADNAQTDLNPDGKVKLESDDTGDILAKSMGLKIQKGAK